MFGVFGAAPVKAKGQKPKVQFILGASIGYGDRGAWLVRRNHYPAWVKRHKAHPSNCNCLLPASDSLYKFQDPAITEQGPWHKLHQHDRETGASIHLEFLNPHRFVQVQSTF